jgi:RHS repeat-associated protein
MDQGHRFVTVETRNDINDGTEEQLVRYQLHNHLGSAALELNGAADVISYEEYHPFGTTAYQANNGAIKSAAKRYRFTGMERDEETGLEYHGARYYLSWLGRWLNADPVGIGDGVNLYQYCHDNPAMKSDKGGMQADDTTFRFTHPPSLLHPVSFEERIAASISPGRLQLNPSPAPPPVAGSPAVVPTPSSPAPVTPASAPPAPVASPSTTATTEPPRPFPITASFRLFSPRLEVRFWQRAQLTADTSAVSLSTINTGDFRARLQYEYGSDISLRLGNPDTGSGSFGYNPSTGVGSFNVSGGSGDSATGLRTSFTATTTGDLSLRYSFGVRSSLGESGVLRVTTTTAFNASTGAFRFNVGLGGELLPTPEELGASVPLAESRARDIIADTGSISPSIDSISGFVDRHTTARPINPANPAGGTATDFGALGTAGGQLGRLTSVPTHPSVRGALQFSITPSAITGTPDFRIMLRAQLINF